MSDCSVNEWNAMWIEELTGHNRERQLVKAFKIILNYLANTAKYAQYQAGKKKGSNISSHKNKAELQVVKFKKQWHHI